MAKRKDPGSKMYYFIDIELRTRKIIGWGTETRDNMEVELGKGYHRVFMPVGQYNKLVRKLDVAKS